MELYCMVLLGVVTHQIFHYFYGYKLMNYPKPTFADLTATMLIAVALSSLGFLVLVKTGIIQW